MRGPHGAERGTGSTIQLAVSTKHPLLQTHTPSGTDSALNFLPVILAAGQRNSNFLTVKEPRTIIRCRDHVWIIMLHGTREMLCKSRGKGTARKCD